MAATAREFVSMESPTMGRAGAGGRPCQGVYYRPAGKRPRTAAIATHYEIDFSEHYLAEYLAERGFGFLGWNTRYRGSGAYFSLDNALVDIGVGVRWLREQADVDTVVIIGNSGGASLMSAYQAVGSDRADLPAADLLISLQAHLGRPDVLTAWMDPAVTDELDPVSVDPALDMFNPDNGPPYAPAFVERYRSGQVARNHRISDWCRSELERLSVSGGSDRMFAVPRTWADLRFADLTIDPSDRPVGCYAGDPHTANSRPFGLAAVNTCRSWLSMWSLVDSNCRAEPHLARIATPSLVVQSTADQGCFPSDARRIHDALASTDKTLALIAGDHYLLTGGRPELADLLSAWIDAHAGS